MNDFTKIKDLGRGAYGYVYKALHNQTKKIVAIKCVPTQSDPNLQKLQTQVNIIKQCSSPYIIKCYGHNHSKGYLHLILQYCPGGSISDFINKQQKHLEQCYISCIMRDCLYGLQYLHAGKKIHRDIKAGNLLIAENGKVKLADFGVAGQIFNTLGERDTWVGSPYWMSPQILSKNRYNSKTDIWSLGITAIEIAQKRPPYSQVHYLKAMFEIKNKPAKGLTQPDKWSTQFNNFVQKCLIVQPRDRSTAKQLLQHPFIVRVINQKQYHHILLPVIEDTKPMTIQDQINQTGTMIIHNSYDNQVFYQQEIQDTGTMLVKETQIYQEPHFMEYIRKKNQEKKLEQNRIKICSSKQSFNQSHSKASSTTSNYLNEFINNPKHDKPSYKKLIDQLYQQMHCQINSITSKYMHKIHTLQSYLHNSLQSTTDKPKINELKVPRNKHSNKQNINCNHVRNDKQKKPKRSKINIQKMNNDGYQDNEHHDQEQSNCFSNLLKRSKKTTTNLPCNKSNIMLKAKKYQKKK